jgi:hypothetical protein
MLSPLGCAALSSLVIWYHTFATALIELKLSPPPSTVSLLAIDLWHSSGSLYHMFHGGFLLSLCMCKKDYVPCMERLYSSLAVCVA